MEVRIPWSFTQPKIVHSSWIPELNPTNRQWKPHFREWFLDRGWDEPGLSYSTRLYRHLCTELSDEQAVEFKLAWF